MATGQRQVAGSGSQFAGGDSTLGVTAAQANDARDRDPPTADQVRMALEVLRTQPESVLRAVHVLVAYGEAGGYVGPLWYVMQMRRELVRMRREPASD